MTVILNETDVRRLLQMDTCIDLVAGALRASSRGDVVLPLRSKMMLPDGASLLGLMPAYLGEPRCFGIKVVSVMPGNHGSAFDAHQGCVLLFEAEHGRVIGVMDASSITAIRTAAASGVATRALAREGAGDLAIVGTGVQARSHLDAMTVVLELRRVRVSSGNPAHAHRFAESESRRTGLKIEACTSNQECIEGADVICTTTSSRTPVVDSSWVSPGAHINAVGACFPQTRELDGATVARARLFTDRRESMFNESGDYRLALEEGLIGEDHLAGEVGEVLLGTVAGRRRDDELTVFESLGIGAEDLAVAQYLTKVAETQRAGVSLEMGGMRNP